MSEKPTLKKGILFLSLEKGLNGTVTILLIPIMIQTMGVESFGFWGILLGLMAYIHCMDCGVSLSIERYVAYYSTNNDYRSLEELLSTAFTMLLLLSFLLLFPIIVGGERIIAALTKSAINLPMREVLLSIYPAFALTWITYVFIGIPRGLQRFDVSSKIQIVGKVTFAVVLLVLFTKIKTIRAAIYAFNAQSCVTLALYVYMSQKLLPSIKIIKLSISVPMLKQMINFGYKIQISAFSFQISQQFDKILLASFYNLSFVGYYDAASRIVYAVREVPQLLISVLISRVSSLLAAGNEEEIKQLFTRVTGSLAVIGFYLGGIMLINSNLIIELILKRQSNSFSVLVFSTLSLTTMWQAMAAGAVYIARGMGKTQIEMKTTVLVLVINIIASYTLIHIVSYRGVVFGTAGAMIISPIYCYYLLCKEFKSSFFNFLFESFAIPVICCGSSITVIFLIRKVVPFSTGKWIDMCVATVSFFILGHVLYYFSNYKPYIELMHIIEVIPNKGREIVNSFFSRKKNS